MSELMTYLSRAAGDHASDLFLVAGGTVKMKLDGRLVSISEQRILPADSENLIREMYALANRPMDSYLEKLSPIVLEV